MKTYYGIMNKDTKKLKNTSGLDVDVFDDIIISSDLEKIKQHIHIDYLYNCVPVKIVLGNYVKFYMWCDGKWKNTKINL